MIHCAKFEAPDPAWLVISSQVARLERLDKFPFGAEGKRELCFALLTADSLVEATVIIDRVMASEATYECPSAPDLRRMINREHHRGDDTAAELKQEYQRQNRGAHCYQCHDFGITETIDASNLRSVAAYCDCAVGRQRFASAHGPSGRCKPPSNPCPDCINNARKKLIAAQNRGRIAPPPKPGEMRGIGEIYNGEF